jgi:hypothetical protein
MDAGPFFFLEEARIEEIWHAAQSLTTVQLRPSAFAL